MPCVKNILTKIDKINNNTSHCVLINMPSTQYIIKGPSYKIIKPWLNDDLILTSGKLIQIINL